MTKLTKTIADEIVKETSLRLHRNINIMNMEGVIIATQDKARIGSVHDGAISVLQSGKTLIVNADKSHDWEGTQPGVNLPIVFREEIIGVVGVTGDPKKMGAIGELVKMTAELMVKQAFMFSQIEWQQRTKTIIAEQLLKKEPSFTKINHDLRLLGLDLIPPFLIMIIDIAERNVTNRTIVQTLEETIDKDRMMIAFITIDQVIITLYDLEIKEYQQIVTNVHRILTNLSIVFRLAYSLPFYELKDFRQSYKDCEIALEISDPNKNFISFEQIEAKSLIHQVENRIADRFSQRVLNNLDDVKAKTLETFFLNNLNIQKTADALFVHRNTLIYRLHKIIEEIGYDPRNFQDALTMQIALWVY